MNLFHLNDKCPFKENNDIAIRKIAEKYDYEIDGESIENEDASY